MAANPTAHIVRQVVAAMLPFDETEASHRRDTLDWIDSGAPLWRTAKPATPPEHLVAYAVVVDPAQSAALLVDHRLAKRWLPPGGHVEPGEHPAASAHRELTEELGLTPTPHPAANGEPVLITRTKTVGLTASGPYRPSRPGRRPVSSWITTRRPDSVNRS